MRVLKVTVLLRLQFDPEHDAGDEHDAGQRHLQRAFKGCKNFPTEGVLI